MQKNDQSFDLKQIKEERPWWERIWPGE